MRGTLLAATLLVAFGSSAIAEPVRLTDAQLQDTTAGYRGATSNSNVAVVRQIAISSSQAIAVCTFCVNATVTAASTSIASNSSSISQR